MAISHTYHHHIHISSNVLAFEFPQQHPSFLPPTPLPCCNLHLLLLIALDLMLIIPLPFLANILRRRSCLSACQVRLQHSPSPHGRLFRLPGERDIDTATLIKMFVANYSRSGRGRSIRNCNLSLAQINTNLINGKESVKRTRSKHTCLLPRASFLLPHASTHSGAF